MTMPRPTVVRLLCALCALLTSALVVSALPTKAASAGSTATGLHWTAGRVHGLGNLIEVTCPSASLCVAVNNAGGVVVSTHPALGPASWRSVKGLTVLQAGGTLSQQNSAAQIDINAFTLSCPSANLCLIAAAGAERPGHAPGRPPVSTLYYTSDPGNPSTKWVEVSGIDGNKGQLASLACSSVHSCHAMENIPDSHGNITAAPLFTTDPTGPASAWTVSRASINDLTEGLACPTSTLCIVGGGNGLYSSTKASLVTGSWPYATVSRDLGQIDSVVCASTQLCFAAQDEAGCLPCGAGNDLISTNPAGAVWRRSSVATGGIACPTTSFCVGTAQGTRHAHDQLVYSSAPTGPASAWHYLRRLAGTAILRAVACASSLLCVAVGDGGVIATGA